MSLIECASTYLKRKPLDPTVHSVWSPHAWVEDFLQALKESGHVFITQQLIAAMLERKSKAPDGLESVPFGASDDETAGLRVGNVVYLVALVPERAVMERCAEVLHRGRHPMLLLPRKMIERGKGAASAIPDLERRTSFLGIEDFLVLGVVELAREEGVSYLAVWESIIGLYNERAARLSGAVPRIEMEIVGEGDGNEG